MRTVHMVLKSKWYDLISCGEKKEEYRKVCDYWRSRLQKDRDPIEVVCFHKGYTKTTMSFKIKYITIGCGREEWGAVRGERYFVIQLGQKIN